MLGTSVECHTFVIYRVSFFNKVNFLVVSLNGVIFARNLDGKSPCHILNLIGQLKVNFLPLGQYSSYKTIK